VLTWAENRYFLDTQVPDYLFEAGGSFFALFYFAIAKILLGKGGLKWWSVLGLLGIGLLLTGSRSTLIHLMGFVTLPLIVQRSAGPTRTKAWGRVAAAFVVAGIAIVGSTIALNFDLGRMLSRFSTAGALLNPNSSDLSRSIRERFTILAWDIFERWPLLGSGPGYNIQSDWESMGWPPIGLGLRRAYPTVLYDTPLIYLATLGIVGMAAIFILGATYWSFTSRLQVSEPRNAANLALRAWLFTQFASTLFSMPLEDRSYMFGFVFLVALALPEVRVQIDTAMDAPLPVEIRGPAAGTTVVKRMSSFPRVETD
jgi:hypothetical protein